MIVVNAILLLAYFIPQPGVIVLGSLCGLIPNGRLGVACAVAMMGAFSLLAPGLLSETLSGIAGVQLALLVPCAAMAAIVWCASVRALLRGAGWMLRRVFEPVSEGTTR